MVRSIRSWQLVALLVVGVAVLSPFAVADIISIQTYKNCSGPTDPACNNGQAFSLESIINGTTSLSSFYPGTTTQAFYLVKNDVSAGLPSFSFNLTGRQVFPSRLEQLKGKKKKKSGPALPSNHFLTCQVNGFFSGDSCSISGPSGTVGTGAQYGPPGLLPATITFSGLSLPLNGELELTFASFGQNNTTTAPTAVPEQPESAFLLVIGLMILGGMAIRFRTVQS